MQCGCQEAQVFVVLQALRARVLWKRELLALKLRDHRACPLPGFRLPFFIVGLRAEEGHLKGSAHLHKQHIVLADITITEQ